MANLTNLTSPQRFDNDTRHLRELGHNEHSRILGLRRNGAVLNSAMTRRL